MHSTIILPRKNNIISFVCERSVTLFFLEKLLAYCLEGFLMAGAGLGIIGTRLKLSKMLIIAFTYALVIHAVRTFYISNGIPFGTHIFILYAAYASLLKFVGKQDILDSLVATSISILLILWGEGTFLIPLIEIVKFDPTSIGVRFGATLIAVILTDIPLIIAFVIGYVFKFNLIDLEYFKVK